MTLSSPLQYGTYVCIIDRHGNIEDRGTIVGRHRVVGGGMIYDIQQRGERSMSKRICGVAENRIRCVDSRVKAYEQKPSEDPRHIKDKA
jgi:hypothetical protein